MILALGTDITCLINKCITPDLCVMGTADCPEVCQLQPAQRFAEWRFVSLSVLCLLQDVTDERKWCQGIRERWLFAISRECIRHVWLHLFSLLKCMCILNIVWKVMEMCYKILGEGKLVTQRELFYKLLSDSPKYFSCQRHVNQSIQGRHNSNTPLFSCFIM